MGKFQMSSRPRPDGPGWQPEAKNSKLPHTQFARNVSLRLVMAQH